MANNSSAGWEQSFDWGEFLHTWIYRSRSLLKKYWWVLLLAVSMGVLVQAFLELRREPVFQSTARLMVSGQIVIPEGQIYREEFARFYETQINLMLSGRVRNAAYNRVGALHPQLPRQEVRLRAFVLPETSIFVLQATSPNASYSHHYLDAVLDEYINFRREMRSQTSEGAYLAITEELVGLEEAIERQELLMVEFQKRYNVAFIQDRVKSIGDRLIRLNNELADMRSELRLISTLPLEQQLEGAMALEGQSVEARGDPHAIAVFSGNPDFAEAKHRVNRLETEMRDYSRYLRPKHPKIIQLALEIERMENRLDAIRQQSAQRLEEAKDILRIRVADKESEIRELETEALENQRRLAEFQQITSRRDLLQSSYQRLQQRLSAIDMNTNIGQETVGILERASPAIEIGGNLIRKTLEGMLLGFLFGGGVLFLIGILDNRVFSVEDLARVFDEPVMGVVPFERHSKNEPLRLLEQNDDRHTFAEACRNLRSSLLLHDRRSTGSRLVLVTSSVPGEGKTTIAANLALGLAYAKIPTLLIDADLRRGRLAEAMKLNRAPGLSELIRDKLPLEEVVQQTIHPDLEILTAGAYPEQPGELLLEDYLDTMLERAREKYSFIIIDSAPVLATDDTTTFFNRVDDILFTVRSGYSRVRQIRPGIDRLGLRGATVTGLVLNYVDSREPNYYYYKYADYYSSRDQAGKQRAVSAPET